MDDRHTDESDAVSTMLRPCPIHSHHSQTQRLSLPTLNCNSSHAGREEHAAGFCLSSIILSPLNGYVKMSPVRQGTLALSQKELQRVAVITSCVKGDLACARAASLLNLMACQTTQIPITARR